MTVIHPESSQDKSRLKHTLESNLVTVRKRIALALDRCKKPGREVVIIAVSKKQPVDKVLMLSSLGQIHFGESYVQEALAKMDSAAHCNIKWHFIGGLQTNKAKYVAGRFALVHSVDSLKLARGLHKKATELNAVQPVLIQVNLAGEKQKSGILETGLLQLAQDILEMRHLRLEGLMMMPPYTEDPEKSRPLFARTRELRDEIEQKLGVNIPQLSMGMSADIEAAVEEGATLVRVGTSLLGHRSGCTFPSSTNASIVP